MKTLTDCLGDPVCLDAAQFNSRAHRLRNYWTNLANASAVQHAASFWQRAPGLQVDQVLNPGRKAQMPKRDDQHPFYPANKQGKPMAALPTLMATPGSYAYREGGPGMVWDEASQTLQEPFAVERERAMGYPTNATASPLLSESRRRKLLGNAIDQNALQALYALCRASSQLAPAATVAHPPSPTVSHADHASCALGGGVLPPGWGSR
jgi:hypothetical protein